MCIWTSFFSLFSYPTYVNKLGNHPFLMTPDRRMQYIAELHHKLKTTHKSFRTELNSERFRKFFNWNRHEVFSSVEPFLMKVYTHNKPYKNRPSDLLKFLRNVYEHFMDGKEVDIEQVDDTVRSHWGEFVDYLHRRFKIKTWLYVGLHFMLKFLNLLPLKSYFQLDEGGLMFVNNCPKINLPSFWAFCCWVCLSLFWFTKYYDLT